MAVGLLANFQGSFGFRNSNLFRIPRIACCVVAFGGGNVFNLRAGSNISSHFSRNGKRCACTGCQITNRILAIVTRQICANKLQPLRQIVSNHHIIGGNGAVVGNGDFVGYLLAWFNSLLVSFFAYGQIGCGNGFVSNFRFSCIVVSFIANSQCRRVGNSADSCSLNLNFQFTLSASSKGSNGVNPINRSYCFVIKCCANKCYSIRQNISNCEVFQLLVSVVLHRNDVSELTTHLNLFCTDFGNAVRLFNLSSLISGCFFFIRLVGLAFNCVKQLMANIFVIFQCNHIFSRHSFACAGSQSHCIH